MYSSVFVSARIRLLLAVKAINNSDDFNYLYDFNNCQLLKLFNNFNRFENAQITSCIVRA